jgi:DNA-binding NtrC family response regulator
MTTILLVEDDPLEAHRILPLLNREFSVVRRATDAAEALCLVEQADFADGLDLVISGHQTKGIGGPAFVAELCARKPDLPVLVLGRAGESPSDYIGEHVSFLPRPFVPQQMVSLASKMLARDSDRVA